MLDWNRSRVQNLTGTEIWLFIVGRVLVGFGLGVYFAIRMPRLATLHVGVFRQPRS